MLQTSFVFPFHFSACTPNPISSANPNLGQERPPTFSGFPAFFTVSLFPSRLVVAEATIEHQNPRLFPSFRYPSTRETLGKRTLNRSPAERADSSASAMISDYGIAILAATRFLARYSLTLPCNTADDEGFIRELATLSSVPLCYQRRPNNRFESLQISFENFPNGINFYP